MFDVYGSMDSLLPKICAVEAVGIGAINKLLRTPNLAILAFNADQSQRPVGSTPHLIEVLLFCHFYFIFFVVFVKYL